MCGMSSTRPVPERQRVVASVTPRTDRHLPAVALAAPLVTILHSFVDFSLEMPAIEFTVSMMLGMGWAQAFRRYE